MPKLATVWLQLGGDYQEQVGNLLNIFLEFQQDFILNDNFKIPLKFHKCWVEISKKIKEKWEKEISPNWIYQQLWEDRRNVATMLYKHLGFHENVK